MTRWRHCGDYVRTYLRDLRLSFSNCVSGASHSYDIKAKSKYKNFNTDQGHQVKQIIERKLPKPHLLPTTTDEAAHSVRWGDDFHKVKLPHTNSVDDALDAPNRKKRSVTKDPDTTKHRIHDSVVSNLDQWQDQQLICK